jgi:hypothetical protein
MTTHSNQLLVICDHKLNLCPDGCPHKEPHEVRPIVRGFCNALPEQCGFIITSPMCICIPYIIKEEII